MDTGQTYLLLLLHMLKIYDCSSLDKDSLPSKHQRGGDRTGQRDPVLKFLGFH